LADLQTLLRELLTELQERSLDRGPTSFRLWKSWSGEPEPTEADLLPGEGLIEVISIKPDATWEPPSSVTELLPRFVDPAKAKPWGGFDDDL
jgi:hypothetical protein